MNAFMEKYQDLAKDFSSLYHEARHDAQSGVSQEDMYNDLHQLMLFFREQESEVKEENISDLLDYVSGFCNPEKLIYNPVKPSNPSLFKNIPLRA